MATLELSDYQIDAVKRLRNGSILRGGVGSGKSRTALAYYMAKVCQGDVPVNGKGEIRQMKSPRDLYIITPAKKRDLYEWIDECRLFYISPERENSHSGVKVTVDSWQNIKKYTDVVGAFFIFDEQHLVGSGAWVKAFYQIAKKNQWILLSATPGDVWMDYIPIFIANGFYKNRTQFIREHVVFNPYAKYQQVQRYLNVEKLIKERDLITVQMDYTTEAVVHDTVKKVWYDRELYQDSLKNYWNPYEKKPVLEISGLCHVLLRITNTSKSRIETTEYYIKTVPRLIIFYNYDYELEILRDICDRLSVNLGEWNGHKHMPIPNTPTWVYLVQYTAGNDAWNCTETDTILFYSDNPSYKVMEQAKGRINRVNSPYKDLFYIHLRSDSPRDQAIAKALKSKKTFNEVRSMQKELELSRAQDLQRML